MKTACQERPPSVVLRIVGPSTPHPSWAVRKRTLGGALAVSVSQVTPPSWRFDIQRECDLVEEVARITGYDKLPARLPTAPLRMGSIAEGHVGPERFRAVLVDRDYQEAVRLLRQGAKRKGFYRY